MAVRLGGPDDIAGTEGCALVERAAPCPRRYDRLSETQKAALKEQEEDAAAEEGEGEEQGAATKGAVPGEEGAPATA